MGTKSTFMNTQICCLLTWQLTFSITTGEISNEELIEHETFIPLKNSEGEKQQIICSDGGWSKIFRAFIAPPSGTILAEIERNNKRKRMKTALHKSTKSLGKRDFRKKEKIKALNLTKIRTFVPNEFLKAEIEEAK